MLGSGVTAAVIVVLVIVVVGWDFCYRGTARTKDTGARMPPASLPALDAADADDDTTDERSIHFENPIPSRTGVG